MSDLEKPEPTETDEEEVEVEEEEAARPATAAEEAGIVDQQAAVLEQMGEDPRTVDE